MNSPFHPDSEAQVTQTVGVNPDPPPVRSASVPADAPPAEACILAPYLDAWGD